MKNYFVNPATGLLRAGWRISLFVVIFFAITAVGMVAARAILGGLPKLSPQQFTVLAIAATILSTLHAGTSTNGLSCRSVSGLIGLPSSISFRASLSRH